MNELQKLEQSKIIIDNCRIELRDMESNVFISPYQRKMYFDVRDMLTKLSIELSLNIMEFKAKEDTQ